MAGNGGGALPKATVGLGRVIAGISGHGTGPFRALRALVMVLTSAPAEPVLGFAQALATAHAVEETLRDGLIKALPMLLGNEDPGKHGHRKATEKKRFKSATRSHYRKDSLKVASSIQPVSFPIQWFPSRPKVKKLSDIHSDEEDHLFKIH